MSDPWDADPVAQDAPPSAPVDALPPPATAPPKPNGPNAAQQAFYAKTPRSGPVGSQTNPAYDWQGGTATPDQYHVDATGNLVAPPGPSDQPWAADPEATDQPPKGDDRLGFETGLMRPLDNSALWLEGGLRKVGVPVDAIDHFFGAPSAEQTKTTHDAYLAQQLAAGKKPGLMGEIAGGAISTLPLMALTKNPMIIGAGSGALETRDPTNVGAVAKDAAIGGVAGKLSDMAVTGAQRAISPVISPYVQTLLRQGVRLTPGQIVGGATHRVEDALTSAPVLGDLIKNAQARGVQDFNRAAVNRALAPIGEKLPAGMVGREALGYAQDKLSAAFEKHLPGLTIQADRPFVDAMSQTVTDANLPAGDVERLNKTLLNTLGSRFNQGGQMTGEDIQAADSQLGQIGARYRASPDPDHQEFADVLADLQEHLRDLVARNAPDVASDLGKAREGWANLVRVQKASGSSGAKDGIFTPAQLANAVRSSDGSVRRGAYARGDALMQDLSDAGKDVLPSTVPDSGTPLRGIIGAAALGHMGGLLHPPVVGTAAALAGLYTKAGQKIVTPLLTRRPPGAEVAAKLLSLAKRPAAGAAASLPAALQDQR